MRTSNSNLATPLFERAEMTIVHQQPKRKYNQKMIRFNVRDMNNHPLSFATVRLTSDDNVMELKFDRESGSYIAKRFKFGMYKLEVTAENFESRISDIYIPKAGIQRQILMAK